MSKMQKTVFVGFEQQRQKNEIKKFNDRFEKKEEEKMSFYEFAFDEKWLQTERQW